MALRPGGTPVACVVLLVAGFCLAQPADERPLLLGKIPEPDDPEWHEVFDTLRHRALPKDLPLPDATPFDAHAAQRLDYLNGYRLGFVAGLVKGYVDEEDDDLNGRTEPFRRGHERGREAGDQLTALRDKAAMNRRWGFRNGDVLTEAPAEGDDRKVLQSFLEFAAGFERELLASFPPTVTVEVSGVARLYAYPGEDYSADNRGTPRRVRHYKGVLEGKRGGFFDWMFVTPKDPAGPDTAAAEARGRYAFYFDYNPAVDAWRLEREPHSRHPDGFSYHHAQRQDEAGREVWHGRDFASVRAIVLGAVDRAQPGRPPAVRPPTVSSQVPRPGELGRPWAARLWGPAGQFLAFSGDGARVLTSDGRTTHVWNAATFQPLGAPLVHANWTHSVAFSPDGMRVATGHDEGIARVWEVGADPAKPLLELRHPEPGDDSSYDDVNALAWSPDGRSLLTGCTHTAQLWDASTGKAGRLLHHDQPFFAALFTPGGETLVTVTHNEHTYRDVGTGDLVSVRGWDFATGRLLWRKDSDYPGTPSVVMSRDGTRVSAVLYTRPGGRSRGVERLFAWDVRTGRELLSAAIPGNVGSHARVHGFTRDGAKLLMSGSDDTGLADAATGEWLSVRKRGESLGQWEDETSVAMTPDGARVAAAGANSRAALWDPATGEVLLDLTGRYVHSPETRPLVAISPGGGLVAVSHGREGRTTVWRVDGRGD